MKIPEGYGQLTKTNRFVYKKYTKKANDLQKAEMRTILKKQIENLKLLYELMINDS